MSITLSTPMSTSEVKASRRQHLLESLPVMSPVPQFGSLNFDGARLQCHICRRWFRGLASHLRHGHSGLTAEEYKAEFGLNKTTPLVSPDISRKLCHGVLKHFAQGPPPWLRPWDKETRPGDGGGRWERRPEGRKRQQIAQAGRLPPNTGQPCPLEQREKISKALKGRPNPRKGQSLWSAEERQKISDTKRIRAKGRLISEIRQKMKEAAQEGQALGKLNYDGQRLECHVCGKWYRGLASHIWQAHAFSCDDYREAFGLNRQTPLVTPDISEGQRQENIRRWPDTHAPPGVVPFPFKEQPAQQHWERRWEVRLAQSKSHKGFPQHMTPRKIAANRANLERMREPKACEHCGQIANLRPLDRFCSKCSKEAHREYNKAYWVAHREKLRQYMREYDAKRRPPKRCSLPILPEEIKKTRQEKGWSQEELARHCGVTQTLVSQWERGLVMRVSKRAAEKLSCALAGAFR